MNQQHLFMIGFVFFFSCGTYFIFFYFRFIIRWFFFHFFILVPFNMLEKNVLFLIWSHLFIFSVGFVSRCVNAPLTLSSIWWTGFRWSWRENPEMFSRMDVCGHCCQIMGGRGAQQGRGRCQTQEEEVEHLRLSLLKQHWTSDLSLGVSFIKAGVSVPYLNSMTPDTQIRVKKKICFMKRCSLPL